MRVFLLFLCYSFLGWACETVYCSIGKRKFVNRGFLNGPLCPVYGFGALAVLYFLRPVSDNIPLLFVSGMVLTSVIEYITGYLLEKLFATKWWDYSSRRFNIHGRVCLRNSLMFGVLSVVAVRVIDPVIRGGIYALPATVCAVLSIVFGAMMVADLVVTVRTILDINSAQRRRPRSACARTSRSCSRRWSRAAWTSSLPAWSCATFWNSCTRSAWSAGSSGAGSFCPA